MRRSVKIWRVAAVTAAVLVIIGGVAWYKGALQPFGLYRPSNSLMVIMPYRHAGTWVFDDPVVGLKREPFVSGVPELIDKLVADIPNADEGFRLVFSAQEFPGYDDKLVWKREGPSGNWYYSEKFKAEGWLCPALFKYFRQAPKEIYVKAEAK